MALLTVIVQVIRGENGVQIGGVVDPNNPTEIGFHMVLSHTKNYREVLDLLAFRRQERRKDHWFGASHLICTSHRNSTGAHSHNLLLEIPIKVSLPFVDLLPCGNLGSTDLNQYRVYLLHTDACVKERATNKEFTGAYPLSALEQAHPDIYWVVEKGIRQHAIS